MRQHFSVTVLFGVHAALFQEKKEKKEKLTTVSIAGVVRQHFSVTVLFGVHAALFQKKKRKKKN